MRSDYRHDDLSALRHNRAIARASAPRSKVFAVINATPTSTARARRARAERGAGFALVESPALRLRDSVTPIGSPCWKAFRAARARFIVRHGFAPWCTPEHVEMLEGSRAEGSSTFC